jgi:hypothetical protein
VLRGTVVAEQEPFFITLGGPPAHDYSVENQAATATHFIFVRGIFIFLGGANARGRFNGFFV